VLRAELNGRAENPLIDVAGQAAWHNGNFHADDDPSAADGVLASLTELAPWPEAARCGEGAQIVAGCETGPNPTENS
jgi:histidine ammonia-lyase